MTTTPVQEPSGVASLPAIIGMARHYDLSAAAFVLTFRSVAMPANHSEPEFVSCCLVAREHGLNPLTKEIYFMRTKAGPIQPIVSVDGWIRKCNEHPQFDGMEFADDRDASGKLIGMFCTIHRKDRAHPIKIREDLAECTAAGGGVWKTSPSRMMRNRVLCQCARIAFGFAGVMDRDEFDQWQSQRNQEPRDITPTVAEIPDMQDAAPADVLDLPEDDVQVVEIAA